VPPEVKDQLGALVTVPFNEAAKLMTDYAYTQEGDELNPLIITAKEAVPSDGMVESIETELERLCPSCKSTTINVPVADWAGKMQGEVQSALAKDPNINYILPLYDPMVMGVVSGVNAAGRSGSVKIASYATTPSVLKQIQDGDVVQMDVGESTDWIAYATLDQALRLMAGEPPIPADERNVQLGLRVFDDSNVDETGTPPTSDKGFGDDYARGYRELWGVQ
jgi:ribose transport system substrate-binding protein